VEIPGLNVGRTPLLPAFQYDGPDHSGVFSLFLKLIVYIPLGFIELERQHHPTFVYNLEAVPRVILKTIR
jgi:hypothetical protein